MRRMQSQGMDGGETTGKQVQLKRAYVSEPIGRGVEMETTGASLGTNTGGEPRSARRRVGGRLLLGLIVLLGVVLLVGNTTAGMATDADHRPVPEHHLFYKGLDELVAPNPEDTSSLPKPVHEASLTHQKIVQRNMFFQITHESLRKLVIARTGNCPRVRSINELPVHWNLDRNYYAKYVEAAGGIPMVGSSQVSDEALLRAAMIFNQMSKNLPREVLDRMADLQVRISIMAHTEVTTDVPEHAHLKDYPGVDFDTRTRGLAASCKTRTGSAAEENILCWAKDVYYGESITVHEMAHTIHEMGLEQVYPNFFKDTIRQYCGKDASLYHGGVYAARTWGEYFAQSAQAYFNANPAYNNGGSYVNPDLFNREQLRSKNNCFYRMMQEIFGPDDVGNQFVCPRAYNVNSGSIDCTDFWKGAYQRPSNTPFNSNMQCNRDPATGCSPAWLGPENPQSCLFDSIGGGGGTPIFVPTLPPPNPEGVPTFPPVSVPTFPPVSVPSFQPPNAVPTFPPRGFRPPTFPNTVPSIPPSPIAYPTIPPSPIAYPTIPPNNGFPTPPRRPGPQTVPTVPTVQSVPTIGTFPPRRGPNPVPSPTERMVDEERDPVTMHVVSNALPFNQNRHIRSAFKNQLCKFLTRKIYGLYSTCNEDILTVDNLHSSNQYLAFSYTLKIMDERALAWLASAGNVMTLSLEEVMSAATVSVDDEGHIIEIEEHTSEGDDAKQGQTLVPVILIVGGCTVLAVAAAMQVRRRRSQTSQQVGEGPPSVPPTTSNKANDVKSRRENLQHQISIQLHAPEPELPV